MTSTVYHTDIIQWLRERQWLVQNGFYPKYHAVFGDPPYGISFMNAHWDNRATPQQYQAWVAEWARLMLDFVYPGAVLAMFGGTRTYHRLATGLEDAGWEIFDCAVAWVYASGFPKSASIDRLIDKAAGAKRRIVGKKISADGTVAHNRGDSMHAGWSRPWMNRADHEKAALYVTEPATPQAARWEGYGTALKPSYEPLVLARAPRAKYTFIDLAQHFGTGALHIDSARIAGEKWTRSERGSEDVTRGVNAARHRIAQQMGEAGRYPSNTLFVCECEGEHEPECPIRQLDQQSGESGERRTVRVQHGDKGTNGVFGYYGHVPTTPSYPGFGGASRFFYQAKAPTWEREAGLEDFGEQQMRTSYDKADREKNGGDSGRYRRNIHPTVKPIQLTEYVARLLLPPPLHEPRRILIPFAGVGSEMIGAHFAGWDEIDGVELTAEYVPINEARRKWWEQFTSYEQAGRTYKAVRQTEMNSPVKHGQLALF